MSFSNFHPRGRERRAPDDRMTRGNVEYYWKLPAVLGMFEGRKRPAGRARARWHDLAAGGVAGQPLKCLHSESEEEAPDADAATSLHRFLLLLITLVRMALLHFLRSVECSLSHSRKLILGPIMKALRRRSLPSCS